MIRRVGGVPDPESNRQCVHSAVVPASSSLAAARTVERRRRTSHLPQLVAFFDRWESRHGRRGALLTTGVARVIFPSADPCHQPPRTQSTFFNLSSYVASSRPLFIFFPAF